MTTKAAISELTPEQEEQFNENLKYVNLVKSKYYFMGDEAESVAYEQLLKAVRDFDPSRGVPLKNLFFIYYQNAMKNAVLQEARRSGRSTYNEKLLMDELSKLEATLNLTTEPDAKKEIEESILDFKRRLTQLKDKTNLSLDKPMEVGDDAVSLYELLEDAEVAAPNIAEYKDLKKRLKQKLSQLEFQILELVEKGYSFDHIVDVLHSVGQGINITRPQQIQYIIDTKIRPLTQSEVYK